MSEKNHAQGSLYPSVAISDTFNALGHLFAASVAYNKDSGSTAWIGFLFVAVAAAVGVGRFGFSESRFRRANEDLASLSAYMALPLVGLSFLTRAGYQPLNNKDCLLLSVCGAFLSGIRSIWSEKLEELLKTIINVFVFVGPVFWASYKEEDGVLMISILVFVFAAVVIRPDRHKRIFGILREDIFHYLIGIASAGIAMRM